MTSAQCRIYTLLISALYKGWSPVSLPVASKDSSLISTFAPQSRHTAFGTFPEKADCGMRNGQIMEMWCTLDQCFGFIHFTAAVKLNIFHYILIFTLTTAIPHVPPRCLTGRQPHGDTVIITCFCFEQTVINVSLLIKHSRGGGMVCFPILHV